MKTKFGQYTDYYKILNVTKNALDTEIKKSYRKLALEHHPDHNKNDPDSEEKFKQITESYGVLIDPLKRKEYDRFRADHLAGRSNEHSQFRYTQQDIFEEMLRKGFGKDVFEELNREFSKSGLRSGNSFFQTTLMGGALGGIVRVIGMIPGPIGRVGQGLRIAHMVGTSLFALKKMHDAKSAESLKDEPNVKDPNILDSVKGVFNIGTNNQDSLDYNLAMTIPPKEALTGANKKISYEIDGTPEQLMIRSPEKVPDGGKLRIKGKGHHKDQKRGDLILQVKVTH
jgi:DnaJ-class molecular chaperone